MKLPSAPIAGHLRRNVVAYVALFVALGGTAYAAGTIGSADVIDNSLVSADLRDGAAVRSADVVDDTSGAGLKGVDIAPDTLTGADIAESTLGTVPQAGQAPVKGYVAKLGNTSAFDGTLEKTAVAACPGKERPLGGGGTVATDPRGLSILSGIVLTESAPVFLDSGFGWRVRARAINTVFPWSVTASVVCGEAKP
jgi:hypothetical protein